MNIERAIDKVWEIYDRSPQARDYHQRHGTESLNVLTVTSPEEAAHVVSQFEPEIRGVNVVEIGAGVGYLALEMAKHARRVWAIETDAAWSWVFTKFLYANKPTNLTWIFGPAESVPWLKADVAVIVTRSGVRRMVSLAEKMAPTIVLGLHHDHPLIRPAGHEDLRYMAADCDRRVEELLNSPEIAELAERLAGKRMVLHDP